MFRREELGLVEECIGCQAFSFCSMDWILPQKDWIDYCFDLFIREYLNFDRLAESLHSTLIPTKLYLYFERKSWNHCKS